jgi:hypothetical protein
MYLVASDDGREALKRNGEGAVKTDNVSQPRAKVVAPVGREATVS